MTDLLELERNANIMNTCHETIEEKYKRVQGQAWENYASLKSEVHRAIAEESSIFITFRKEHESAQVTPHPVLDSITDSYDDINKCKWSSIFFTDVPEPSNIEFAETNHAIYKHLSQLTNFSKSLKGSLQGSLPTTNFSIALSKLTETTQSYHNTQWIKENHQPKPNKELDWTDEKNERRCKLIDKEIDEKLSYAENLELEKLQKEMLAYRRRVAPLPLKEAQKLHQHLLNKATEHED